MLTVGYLSTLFLPFLNKRDIIIALLLGINEKNNDKEQNMAYTDLIEAINEQTVEKLEMTVGSTSAKVKLKDVEKEKNQQLEQKEEDPEQVPSLPPRNAVPEPNEDIAPPLPSRNVAPEPVEKDKEDIYIPPPPPRRNVAPEPEQEQKEELFYYGPSKTYMLESACVDNFTI